MVPIERNHKQLTTRLSSISMTSKWRPTDSKWSPTEGVPRKEATPVLDLDRDLIEVCSSVLSRMPIPPANRESGNAAYYMTREDLVNLPPIETFSITEGYVATKFHEYAHSTGH
jgi:hypothetical protein